MVVVYVYTCMCMVDSSDTTEPHHAGAQFGHLNMVVCQTSYAYSLLMSSDELCPGIAGLHHEFFMYTHYVSTSISLRNLCSSLCVAIGLQHCRISQENF